MPYKGQTHEISCKWKSRIQGNPSYRKSFMQGEPLANIRGNHLQREINYTRKPLIYGNSCKVNALFNKGAHPRPSLFEESNVHLKISKAIGKTKETKTTKEVKAKTMNNFRENQTKQQRTTFRPMSAKVDMGLKVCFVCLVVSMVVDSVCLDLFGYFGFFGFPDGC